MKESSSESSVPQQEPSPLEEKRFQRFIEDRDIKPEDLPVIEDLLKYPKEIFVELHNFFPFSKEKNAKELERSVDTEKERSKTKDKNLKIISEERMAVYELFRRLSAKYDWTVLWNLNGILEEKTKTRLQIEFARRKQELQK
ncbi:MAG: hypothetical protein HYY55_03630 [Candidatus Niyogibacteria bacterium]|nr:MAG: hypothetical protein HYY55_03630 [Candidatus Niyogibacteria bacterium]